MTRELRPSFGKPSRTVGRPAFLAEIKNSQQNVGLRRTLADRTRGGARSAGDAGEDVGGELQPAAEGVLDLVGKEAVHRVGLVPREVGKPLGGPVGAREPQNRLQEAREAGVEGRA